MAAIKEEKSNLVFGGTVTHYSHDSEVCKCSMRFAVITPEGVGPDNKAPVIYWLSGLTCTDENFVTKAGAFKAAKEAKAIIVCPDTSPRPTEKVEDEDAAYDFGSGAGFYINATVEKWANQGYFMYDYVTKELPALVEANLPVTDKKAIMGHSMGGHGALTLALKNPGMYSAATAFAPICNPVNCQWGQKAFEGYLGSVDAGKAHDASELVKAYAGPMLPIKIDQGSKDNFYPAQLLPEAFVEASSGNANVTLDYNMREGYDHSYYFITSFIEDHIAFIAKSF